MASKWKKKLKKAAKIAVPVLGALALAKRAKSKAVSGTDDAGLGVSHFKDYITKKAKPEVSIMPDDPHKFRWPNKGGGIAKRGTGVALKHGGRISKKHGGRTGKQFGGGLGSTARRDMRSGYYPSDMGMRGGTMYKKGGRVKSMGVAKRGGGVAKK